MSITSYENLRCETAFKFRPAVAYQPPKLGVSHRDVTYNHEIYGPCNGLFLLAFGRDVGYSFEDGLWLLWNPATRDVFRVPTFRGFPCSYLGFGFDHVTKDYKVVCFSNREIGVLLLVYSLATNSWRHVNDVNGIGYGVGKLFCKGHCLIGCKHHWIMSEVSGGPTATFQFLLSFDMVDEVFVQTRMPCDEPHCSYRFLEPGFGDAYPTIYHIDTGTILEGAGTTAGEGMHIWGLNQYGSTGSWNKLKSLTIPRVVASSPMMFWKNKAIVFANRDDQQAMTRYDLITGEMTSLQFHGDNTIVAYTESLFPVAKFARQPPPNYPASVSALVLANPMPYYASLEMFLLHHQHMSSGGRVPPEEDYTLLEAEFQRLVQEHYGHNSDDDDSSSTDSAFLMPAGPPLEGDNLSLSDSLFVDDQTDSKFYTHRKNEQLRLAHLPYCLREANQPMISNPCTF